MVKKSITFPLHQTIRRLSQKLAFLVQQQLNRLVSALLKLALKQLNTHKEAALVILAYSNVPIAPNRIVRISTSVTA